ncbi:hypothetical protein [Paraliomyxa miuraensis]|uniref:hypothetical protein n=1 Tax=Paraliomyxa miuraensis TaxID=376150 RepID=UPI002253983E|nr:hypothetical protein [Paraliomyxa miuraensis]MCX4241269.1 hypothetical protein [Paraliomyxa miuraensis]
MLRHTAAAALFLTASLTSASGCWMTNPDTPVIEAEDVRMDPPGANGFRAAGDRGDVYQLALDVSGDVNGWVTDVAVGMTRIVRELNRYPEDRIEDDWRIYGPHDDEDGKDGAWMAKIQGDESGAVFEVYIGRRGASEAEMTLLIDGEISVSDEQRDGAFTIDFDTIYAYSDLIDDADPFARYGGKIAVTFERDTDSKHKQVDLDFRGFWYDDGEDDLDFDGESYTYRRDAEGAGQFHFATLSSFERSEWSGPQLERMVVDMRWDAEEAGRARGMIVEVDGEGDLRHGDITVHECFDGTGGLTWRELNEPYADYDPSYSFGDERSCEFDEAALAILPVRE